jgi:hypothetical protein
MPYRPTLSGPEQSCRRLVPFTPLIAKEIRSRIDPGLRLNLECEYWNQDDSVARVIENLVDLVRAIDNSSNKTRGLRKDPFRCNDSRFLSCHACMDRLP